MPSVTVSLNSGSKKISVNQDKVSVSISKGERVTWTCPDGDFQIAFQSGLHPANPNTTKDGDVWVASSGPFAQQTTIKYDVSSAGYTTLDPQIEIVP